MVFMLRISMSLVDLAFSNRPWGPSPREDSPAWVTREFWAHLWTEEKGKSSPQKKPQDSLGLFV